MLTRKSWNIGEYWKSLINMHGFLYTWKNTITVWNFLECNGYIWLGDRTNVFNIKRHLVLPFWEAVEPFNNSPELFLSALTSQTATWFHSVIGHSPLSCSHTLAINVAFHYLKKKKNGTQNNGFKIEGVGKPRMNGQAKAVTYLWTEHYKKVISPETPSEFSKGQ